MTDLLPLFSLVAGLACGAALAAWLLRPRLAAATERGRAESVAELATAREGARLLAEDRARLQARLDALQVEAEQWRRALDEANQARAQLGERAERLLVLEQRHAGLEREFADAGTAAAGLREAIGRAQAALQAEREAQAALQRRLDAEAGARTAAEGTAARLSTELAELAARHDAERSQFEEKLAFVEDAKRALTDQFRSLANDILEEKGKRLAEQHQAGLGTLLDPLRQKLTEFQAKVEDVYVREGKDRSALAEQVRQLMGLNQMLSADARNLTSALKGSNKTQGNWGEVVLERVLESCGLRKGEEFRTQDSHTQDGRRLQPDVIVALPEDRSLVIDAKMSLTAYETYASSDDETVREAALRAHLQSVRAHIKGLSAKDYQRIHQLRSLDFVLMFIPVEPAFMAAVTHDRELFKDAWDSNVLLVSPSTLLFVLRTVAHLWRQEAQNQNAQEIARRGAELYDRLCGFADDLEKLGTRLRQAQDSFDDARNKLARNKGNVIRQAEMLRELGVKPSKALPRTLLDAAGAGAGPEHDTDRDADEALAEA